MGNGRAGRISIIVPVLNEAAGIGPLLDHLERLQAEEPPEVILVDGSDEGDTIRAVTRPGPKLLRSARGRARQMNAGAAAATGGVLLFLHADTRLPPDALPLIGRALEREDISGGAFDLQIESDRMFLKAVSRIASLRSRLTRIPYGDQAIFLRKTLFQRIGGYPEIPIMEDVELMRRVKKAGARIHLIPKAVRTSARRWEKEGVYRGTLRNLALIISFYLGVAPERLSRHYRGGKDVYGG